MKPEVFNLIFSQPLQLGYKDSNLEMTETNAHFQKAHNYAVFRGYFSFFGSNLVTIVPVLLSNFQ